MAPSEAQQEEMKRKYPQNNQFAAVLKSAASSSEPIYRQTTKQIRENIEKASRG
jgi:hypothetical protein